MNRDKLTENRIKSRIVLVDILVVALPIVLSGIAGNITGLGTITGGAIINLGYLLSIIAGSVVLKRRGSGWNEIGLSKPESWTRTVLYGMAACIAALVLFVVVQVVAASILAAINLSTSEIGSTRFLSLEGNIPLLLLMIALAWTTITFGEEMFYRAFLISRMVDYTGIGRGLAVLISGAVFGAAHFAEGPLGILSNGAFGLLFGWIYLRSGRNLWITIIGHGLLNTLRFALLYTGQAG